MSASALVSVYFRSEGYYVTPSSLSTAGVWLGSGAVSFIRAGSRPAELGQVVVDGLSSSTVGVRHPAQSEWPAHTKAALAPLMKAAGVRSWKDFVRLASLVEVVRDRDTVTVVPYHRDERRVDVFHEVAAGRVPVDLDDFEALGRSIEGALSATDP
jgi:hypothetical protein